MSAETLRRAAALMRERAEAARCFYSELHPKTGQEVPWHTEGELRLDFDEEQGPHIASWHPAVALAVADWLTYVADTHDETACPAMAAAEQVARAYLGEQP